MWYIFQVLNRGPGNLDCHRSVIMQTSFMIKLIAIVLAICTASMTFGQEIHQQLKHFTRVVASPRVNVILNHGEQEAIRVVYHDVSKDKINIEQTGRTLRIY